MWLSVGDIYKLLWSFFQYAQGFVCKVSNIRDFYFTMEAKTYNPK